MSTVELRHIISEYLTHIEDKTFLNALKTIVESKVSESTYNLTDFQKQRILSAKKELEKNLTVSNESVMEEIDQWLNSL